MKKLLVITITIITMASCAVVDKTMIAGENNQVADSGNVAERLIGMINDYTNKINAVESVYDLFFISEKCYKEKMSFEKNYAEEITAFKSSLTDEAQATLNEAQATLNEAIKSAMDKFEEAVNKKAKTLAEKQGTKE